MTDNDHREANISFVLIAVTVVATVLVGIGLWFQTLTYPSATTANANTNAMKGNSTSNFRWGRRLRLTPTPITPKEEAEQANPTTEAADSTSISELDEVTAIVNKATCFACHTIPNIPNAVGQVGPDLSNIGAEAATRIEGYTSQEYLRESILDPNAFIAPKCPNGPCPQGAMVLPVQLSQAEVDTMVNYLSSLGLD